MNDRDSLLDNLNAEQVCAVTAKNSGSLLILAGAGCGKTTVLTRRVAFLIKNGTPPNRICALTFSRKAAEEMGHRIAKLDADLQNENAPLVTTFHAFALRTLTEKINGVTNFERIGFRGEMKLMDESERLSALPRICDTGRHGALGMNAMEIDAALNVFASFPEKAQKKYGEKNAERLAEIDKNFRAYRKSNGFWDFNDLINGCMELFQTDAQIAKHYANLYDVILVDEFQDTNPAQIELLEILLARGAALYAVGDDDQAIYGFRGADIRPITNFCARFKDAAIIKLQTNYRSIPAILNCANKLWKDKPITYRKTLVCGLAAPPVGCKKPHIAFYQTFEDALTFALDTSRELNKKFAVPINDCAILFRLNETREFAANFFALKNLSENDRPQLLTVHASKGLEYPAVFLCDLEEGLFPNYKLSSSRKLRTWRDFFKRLFKDGAKKEEAQCDLDEERRLFYVALTRAQRFLYLLSAREKQYQGRTKRFKRSRFLWLIR